MEPCNFGAEEKTRTFTRIPPLDPEPSASTNSATSATDMNMLIGPVFVKTFFTEDLEIRVVFLVFYENISKH